jgi:hypothetical protein
MEERPPDPPNPSSPESSPPPIASSPPWGGAPTGPSPPDSTPPMEPIPWEQPGLGFFASFYETLRLLATQPRRAYERVAVTSAIARPLGFGVLIAWPGILATTLWDIALRSQLDNLAPWLQQGRRYETPPVFEITFALAAPCWLPIALFVGAALQHLFLWMVGGAKRGYAQTFRVLCYAQVSAALGVIPLCGSVLGAIWHLVLQVIGLSATHRIGTGRAVMAILLPLILCCGCVAVLFSIFGAAWMAMLRGSNP